ncbi:MAG: hypothetical protein KJ804_16355 [Proteobacteria bacterium]|nr:hypothetical protein [Pseudomonadota bacterium]MBU1059882.1 hypothetical protein [Pseudomonadota bacterium]
MKKGYLLVITVASKNYKHVQVNKFLETFLLVTAGAKTIAGLFRIPFHQSFLGKFSLLPSVSEWKITHTVLYNKDYEDYKGILLKDAILLVSWGS